MDYFALFTDIVSGHAKATAPCGEKCLYQVSLAYLLGKLSREVHDTQRGPLGDRYYFKHSEIFEVKKDGYSLFFMAAY